MLDIGNIYTEATRMHSATTKVVGFFDCTSLCVVKCKLVH